jgi:PPOX class probable F420-dependent enzyme
MRVMTEAEWKAFLVEKPRTGKFGTTRADGSPHVTPIWYDLDDDGSILFTTGGGGLKAKAIRRDPRVAVCVDEEAPPYHFVLVEGTATLSEDLDEMLIWATRFGTRYMGAEKGEEFGQRNAVPGEVLVRITPTKVTAWADMAD